jgi:hypothetical protein
MNKIIVLGSCLSGLVAKELVSNGGYSLVGSLNHIAIESFANFLIKKSFGAKKSIINDLFQRWSENNGGVDNGDYARFKRRLDSQSLPSLQGFLKKIENCDAIIIDNNYDLNAQVFKVSNDVDALPVYLSNVGFLKDVVRIECCGLADIDGLADAYETLINELLRINNRIKIIVIQYPLTGFGDDSKFKNRIIRARHFQMIAPKINAFHIPLLNIPSCDLSKKGAYYFADNIHCVIARTIDKILYNAKSPFNPSVEIEIADLERFCQDAPSLVVQKAKDNPYQDLPKRQFWKNAIGERYPLAIDQLYDKKYPISINNGIATCGSCFAQHIGRRLQSSGFNYLDVEKAPDTIPAKERVGNGYGIYSARYGNVYTSTQLLQLTERALSQREYDEVWALPPDKSSTIRYVDPFRPNLTPVGYATPEEMFGEQKRHLAAVRELFTKLDIFIFTMGLTEHWYNKTTGAAYPISPGVTAGKFDPNIHAFRNLNYEETMRDMLSFIDLMQDINPNFKMLLTVSPVPLTATAENRHVLVSTIHSKSILRAVAGELASRFDFIDYFPSYEIIMSPPFRGMFFQNNMRTVHEQGVDFVMSHFFAQHKPAQSETGKSYDLDNEDFCDEVFLELER